VFCKAYIYGFSVFVVFASETQFADNGHTLVKICNEAGGRHGNVLRDGLSSPMGCVEPLGKSKPFAAKRALRWAMTDQLNP